MQRSAEQLWGMLLLKVTQSEPYFYIKVCENGAQCTVLI